MAAKRKQRAKKAQPAPPAPPRIWVPKLGMLLLRVFTGALFIDAVHYKVWTTRMAAPEDGGLGLGLADALKHFVEYDYEPLIRRAMASPPEVFGVTWQWYAGFLENVMLPGVVPEVMGPAILIFELLLGIALVLGLCVRLMAALGALLMVAFGMAKGLYFLSIGSSNWLLCFVLIAFALTAAGRIWGLDARLQRRFPGWIS